MFDAKSILDRARASGIRLSVHGDRIAVTPAKMCPPELMADIRAHKAEVLVFLRERQWNDLPQDCVPWLHIARQVIDGEFISADRSTIQSLRIGLQNISHTLCKRALQKLTQSEA